MVDFRYHLVSLISVFLALAVGVVLGAGPLRGTISDQLSAQVEQLRQDKEDLRVELEAANGELDEHERYLEAAGPILVADALPDYRVVLVRLPGSSDEVAAGITARIEQAGAQVVGTVTATEMWADPDQDAFRAQVAGSLSALLELDEASDTDALAHGLALALTDAQPGEAGEPTALATQALETLTSGKSPLLTGEVRQAADAVLVLSGATQEPNPEATVDPQVAVSNDLWAAALSSLGSHAPTVVAGFAATTIDLLPVVRSAGGVATVDEVDAAMGQLSVPLALASAIAGQNPQAYGFGIGANAPVPPAANLQPPQREPITDPTADGSAGASTDPTVDPSTDPDASPSAGEQ